MDIGPIFTEDILPALCETPASDGSPQRGWPNAQSGVKGLANISRSLAQERIAVLRFDFTGLGERANESATTFSSTPEGASMPTYVCSADPARLSPARKRRIAQEITRVHHELTGAPRFFVQVQFRGLEPADQFIAGSEPTPPQVFLHGEIREHRTAAQRRSLIGALVQVLSRELGVEEADVWVYLAELPAANMAEYGHVLPEAGQEQAWFAALPQRDRDHMLAMDRQRSSASDHNNP